MSRDATPLDVIRGDAQWAVVCADALDALRSLSDSSIDAIVTDPPYYRVKGEPWDRAWDTPAAFIAWIGELADEWHRVLRPNGSLYCFASPRMAARVEVAIGERFEVLNSITWRKPEFSTKAEMRDKEAQRAFFPASERIIFAEHYGADTYADGSAGWGAKCDQLRGFVFEPLRAYLDGERRRAGVDKAAVNVACGFSDSPGGMASRHYFSQSQWCLPTREHYGAMQALFNARANGAGPVLRREYEDLRREYEDLRRPFTVSANVPYTDVWTFATVPARPGKHVCEKPAALIEHIVMASTRPGAVILDCFAGSGVVGEVAIQNERRAVLVDACPKWSRRAAYRCGMARAVQRLPGFDATPPPRVETLAMDFEAAP